MKREVAAELDVEITAPTTLGFQIAVAPHPNTEVSGRLSFVLDGNLVQPLEIRSAHGTRIHKLDVPLGNLAVNYVLERVSLWVCNRLEYYPMDFPRRR